MFYHLLYPLHQLWSGLNVFQYITVRSFFALFIAMFVYLIFAPRMILLLQRKQFLQAVRDDGPQKHLQKIGTPTMGGVLIWISVVLAMLFCGRFDHPFVTLGIGVTLAFAVIGFIDDYRKVMLRDPKGLKSRYKFLLQVAVSLFAAWFLFEVLGLSHELVIPFAKSAVPDFGYWVYPLAVLVIAGCSNAVNLTDGLDGLVSMPAIISFLAYAIIAYVAGNVLMANYLQVPSVPGSGELAVFCAAIVGGLLGFLWFNAHPATIFMGDVGALPLGAALGYVALVTKQEILLVGIGGIFVIETLSVMAQVLSFKLTKKRIFRMAPLHHHFELKGWDESKVIVRFWILAIVMALLSLATLKLR